MSKTILIMAGGTGGHIFPALAVAEKMRDRGWHVVWLGNPEGMEARLVPQHGFEMVELKFAALRGKGLLRKLLLPFNLLRGFWQAQKAIRQVQPEVVLGMGGYITFPGGMMASLLGKPLVVHEQNSVAGLANRVLAGVADQILTGFPEVLDKGVWVGNPVRPEIAALAPPAERYAERTGALRLLVIGGSLGAQVLNEMVPQGMALLTAEQQPQIVHQAGEKHIEALKANYAAVGVQAHCVSFIEDMAGAYEWADLVICRAGALTVAELAAAGVASILVPFPHAVDDHQTGNAKFLVDAGGAILLPQNELTADAIALIRNYSRGQLLEMAENARSLAKPDATEEVANICAESAK
ncbi:UDP-N-acetylglucosamine--N-acetylmuramyl-(pentapeptide) pyrophosphoryl-undecaprenol N-acetylglucosamine transferase [Dechloromonas denitrificans]|uniref:UDP-N-acetylglucosamine--N-acetylmuramyl-(pentapeptide) pyrophosphoryl-undecaprenol N-acetylglucosamine transferase n=1 Tax=Dechloromonas denitrificans TaxID=281362 RepID=A0A133XEI8_9RHOO|nr:undecaprenyldiphospho-muramoylpentapeptide beta-N-acetylglucosaminyltransferase [Dechloromonas denitrificans]KXB29341.1 UDP-N-acetylglucosamine--N-acetylmuramyl-(pentapeptide) pyrophosphoryl-undecaprenol N-acetylglucosamine transferase [Dechloromonas denitrificans]